MKDKIILFRIYVFAIFFCPQFWKFRKDLREKLRVNKEGKFIKSLNFLIPKSAHCYSQGASHENTIYKIFREVVDSNSLEFLTQGFKKSVRKPKTKNLNWNDLCAKCYIFVRMQDKCRLWCLYSNMSMRVDTEKWI